MYIALCELDTYPVKAASFIIKKKSKYQRHPVSFKNFLIFIQFDIELHVQCTYYMQIESINQHFNLQLK